MNIRKRKIINYLVPMMEIFGLCGNNVMKISLQIKILLFVIEKNGKPIMPIFLVILLEKMKTVQPS